METSSDLSSVFAPRSAALRQGNNAILVLPERLFKPVPLVKNMLLQMFAVPFSLPNQSTFFLSFSPVSQALGTADPSLTEANWEGSRLLFIPFTPYFSSTSSITFLTTCCWGFFSIQRFILIPTVFFYFLRSWLLSILNTFLYLYGIFLKHSVFFPDFPLLWKFSSGMLDTYSLFYCYKHLLSPK